MHGVEGRMAESDVTSDMVSCIHVFYFWICLLLHMDVLKLPLCLLSVILCYCSLLRSMFVL